MLSILFDMLQILDTRRPASRRSTEYRRAEPPRVEPPARYVEPPVYYEEPPAYYEEPPAYYDEPPAYEEPPVKYAKPAARPDDLRRIEGIGPKTSKVLMEAGITTFSQLAATDVEDLKQILAAGGLGDMVDPTSWPEQARLAEAGDWEAFQNLKDELARGRI